MNAITSPSHAAFRAAYETGRGTLIWTTGVADLETPVGAYLKLASGRPNTFLLESIEGGAARSRYSIIGMAPDLVWRCRAGAAELNRNARAAPHAFVPEAAPPLQSLRNLIAESRMELPDHLPPMLGGLVGYLGYDMVRQMERLPDQNPDELGLPEALLVRPSIFAVFDNVRDELTLAAPIYPQPGLSADTAWEGAQAALAEADAALMRPLPHATPPVALPPQPEPASNMTKAQFMAVVERMKEYIAAGDAFQVVPSQRFSAPFLFFLVFGGFAVCGSSPEILVRLRDGTVTLRPLAGTRPR
ncbi:MAG: chorismate-binding protein, partial [Acetobacteraceae bacterium]|nr:chorismate-binding protein [Acetobacteraceae bacterium]